MDGTRKYKLITEKCVQLFEVVPHQINANRASFVKQFNTGQLNLITPKTHWNVTDSKMQFQEWF